jgi:hypothetical protein
MGFVRAQSDSVNVNTSHHDGIEQPLINDSLETSRITRATVTLDSATTSFNQHIDRLDSLQLDPGAYNQAVDSLCRGYHRMVSRLQTDSLPQTLQSRIDSLDAKVRTKTSFLDSLKMTGLYNHLSIKDRPGIKLPDEPHMGAAPFQISTQSLQTDLPQVPGIDANATSLPDNLPSTDGLAPQIPDNISSEAINQQISGATEQVTTVKDMVKSPDVEDVGNKVESGITQTDALGNVQEQLQKGKDIPLNPSENLPTEISKDALQQEVKKRFARSLTNPFKGKEKVIADDMTKFGKLQKKYTSLADTRNVPKHRTNTEKEKPFVYRLIPGFSFEVVGVGASTNHFKLSQYCGYRFSDRFRASIGYVYQTTFDVRKFQAQSFPKPFGLRLAANYKIVNNTFAHVEYESVSKRSDPFSRLYPNSPNYEGRRFFLQPIYFGAFKTITFGKRFDWTIVYLFRLDEIAHFTFQRSVIRSGIEYRISYKKANK